MQTFLMQGTCNPPKSYTFRIGPEIKHFQARSQNAKFLEAGQAFTFPAVFGTAIKCEIARRFPRSVVKVGLNVQCKNISISSGVQP